LPSAAAYLACGLGAAVLEKHHALGQLAGEVLAEVGVDLAAQLVVPGRPHVRPRLDRELPRPGRLDREAPAPAHAVDVRVERPHRGLEPAPTSGRLVLDDGAQLLVAIAEDVGLDVDGVVHGSLGRIAATVHDGGRMRDPDAPWRFGALGGGHPGVEYPTSCICEPLS
jgi:hypothetical protein